MPQVQIVSAYGMPMALLGLHRYLETSGWRWLAVFALAWLFQALVSGHYLFFFPVLLGLWLLWFVPPWLRPREFVPIVCAWTVASLPLVPILATYRTIQQAFGFSRSREEILRFSADLTALLEGSPLLALWQSPLALRRPEGELFPGVTVTLLTVIGVTMLWRGWARVSPEGHDLVANRRLARLRTALALVTAASGRRRSRHRVEHRSAAGWVGGGHRRPWLRSGRCGASIVARAAGDPRPA
jgi:hypothetical protein